MYMPHTVTVYNSYENPATFESSHNVTVLKGVFLDEVKGASVRATGMESADAAVLYIPLDIAAQDGFLGTIQKYVGWREYQNAEDKSELWSLSVNGDSFFVKGEVVIPNKDFSYINANYDGVFRVTKVDIKDFGSRNMQHIEVGGA